MNKSVRKNLKLNPQSRISRNTQKRTVLEKQMRIRKRIILKLKQKGKM